MRLLMACRCIWAENMDATFLGIIVGLLVVVGRRGSQYRRMD
jgi:hypothetical protein